MPYDRQQGGKSGHIDLVKNPDVDAFLKNCKYMREPSDEEGKSIAMSYLDVPSIGCLPEKIIASDASTYSKAISDRFPSTQVGYVKVSLVLVDLKEFNSLTEPGSRYVDPFKVAKMHRNANSIAFTLPGSNIRFKDEKTVKDGFRRAIFEQFSSDQTNLTKNGQYSLTDTLLAIHEGSVEIKKCPSCGLKWNHDLIFNKDYLIQECEHCRTNIYITDDLRIHEQVTDYGDCGAAITRFMNVVEHLLVAGVVRMLADDNPRALSNMGFVLDGPLAIFGQPADIHKRLMSMYHSVSEKLLSLNLQPPLVLGLQKDGQVMEHARSLVPFFDEFCRTGGIKKSFYRAVDDCYRGKYISEVSSANFGHETYYGQDFIYRTDSGRIFVVGIPYPFKDKSNITDFAIKKADPQNFGGLLARAFDLIRYFELDLYSNAIVPVALAHRHASISLVPGGKVLDIMTRAGLS
ncbi:MAG: DNA double-strand break repair nuclease NurA [Desulfuromonadales bacterium]|nr:DNA double-strand break repair nuclease NurA [Desulfuromonadales bacterium]